MKSAKCKVERSTTLRFASRSAPRRTGFTLVELLVVVFILAAVLGMVTLRLTRDDRDIVRDEADRLVLVLQAAREEAVLQSALFVFELNEKNYRFLRPEKDALAPISEGPFSRHQFPPRLEAKLEIDGQAGGTHQMMVLDPSGALTAFALLLTVNDARWWVLGGPDGRIRSLPTRDARPS
jgi:general secretion pathway protein H